MDTLELRLIRYFVTVADELHFGRAADRLHLTQPGLSQQIQALERRVGARLLERSSRQVRLTPAGQVMLEEGHRLLAQADRAVERVRRTGRGEIGRVTLAAIGSATYDVVPALLRAHHERFPDVDLVLREMSTPAQVNALRTGEVDVGFVRLPADMDDLVSYTVRTERMALMLPESHALAPLAEVPLRALAHEPLILFPSAPRPSWADAVVSACREAGFEPIIAQEAMESATVVSFVAAGMGVALVPEGLQVLARTGVCCRMVAPPAPHSHLAMAHRAGEQPPVVAALLDVVRELWPSPGDGAATRAAASG